MTIIVYRDGVVAADTQVMAGAEPGYRVGFGPKIHRVPGGVVAHMGCMGASLAALRWLQGGREGDPPAAEGGSIVWFPDDGPISVIGDGSESVVDYDSQYQAWGSGEQFALAAMWMGADAVKAVECAIAFDVGCGGTVTTLEVGPRPLRRMTGFMSTLSPTQLEAALAYDGPDHHGARIMRAQAGTGGEQ